MSNPDDLLAQMRRLDPDFVKRMEAKDADLAQDAMRPAARQRAVSDTGTPAALDAAIEQYRTAPMGSSDRTTVDRAITAHVEAEVARRLAAAPEVEAALDAYRDAVYHHSMPIAARHQLRAAIAADKARAVAAAHAEADQLSHFVNDVIRRVGARERGAGGQTVDAGTTRLLADAGRRIDAMIARDKARPTPDEARRLVDAYGSAVDKLAGLGDLDRPSMTLVDDLRMKHNAARTALLRALGVEA